MPTRWTEADARRYLQGQAQRSSKKPPRLLFGVPCEEPVFLVLPYPPLNNRYYRHVGEQVLISVEGRRYHQLVRDVIQGEWPRHISRPFNNTLLCVVHLYKPSLRHRPDIDAPLKAPLDALTKAGVYLDDKQVCKLEITRHRLPRPPLGRVEITLSPYVEED